MKADHREACDHERAFVLEHYEAGTDRDRVKLAEMYNEYRVWIEANGYKALGSSKFAARVEAIIPGCERKKIRFSDATVQGFARLRRQNVADAAAATIGIWET